MADDEMVSITNSRSLPKPMSIKSVIPSNHLILCCPLLLLPSIFPRIRVFSNESVLHIRWPKYWSFNFNISPSNEHPRLISFRMDCFGSPHSPRDCQESSPAPQFKSINSLALGNLWSNSLSLSHIHTYFPPFHCTLSSIKVIIPENSNYLRRRAEKYVVKVKVKFLFLNKK